jgi:hypothetical protein
MGRKKLRHRSKFTYALTGTRHGASQSGGGVLLCRCVDKRAWRLKKDLSGTSLKFALS